MQQGWKATHYPAYEIDNHAEEDTSYYNLL